jgi:hypothetical protein
MGSVIKEKKQNMSIRAEPQQTLLLISELILPNKTHKTANKSAFSRKIQISPYLPK